MTIIHAMSVGRVSNTVTNTTFASLTLFNTICTPTLCSSYMFIHTGFLFVAEFLWIGEVKVCLKEISYIESGAYVQGPVLKSNVSFFYFYVFFPCNIIQICK